MNVARIQGAVDELHAAIWKQRRSLGIDAGDPVAMLEPAIAAAVLGYRLAVVDDLGSWARNGAAFAVAGTVHRARKLIQVSDRFPLPIQRFTAAHELGHVLLHKGTGLHRDRPLESSDVAGTRPPEEAEADNFGARYLIPANLLRREFGERFGSPEPLRIDDTTAFWLSPRDADVVFGASTRELARMVATAHSFGGRRIRTLADRFLVSPGAMAIRLEEAGLVR